MMATLPIRGDGAPQITNIDELVTDFLRDNNLPGATVAASRFGRLVWSKAYGYANTAEKLPMETRHRCRIGSCSKLFTCAAMLKLVEDGHVSMTTPVYTLHVGNALARHGLTGRTTNRRSIRMLRTGTGWCMSGPTR